MTQKKNTKKKVRITTYKNPEIYEILDKIPLFLGLRSHNIGEIVRFKNNSLAQVIKKRNSGRTRTGEEWGRGDTEKKFR